MDDMIPSHPTPALLTTPKKVGRPKGKWAIALALLFLVMVARHRGGWLANIARHDLRNWLTTSTKIPVMPGARPTVVSTHPAASPTFIVPIHGARLIQSFGWTTTHGTAAFHSAILVTGRPDTAVISGVVGQVESIGTHEVSIATKGHVLVTYVDLASLSVHPKEHLGSRSIIGHVGPNGHLGIAITDQGLPINPLVSSCFGPRAFS